MTCPSCRQEMASQTLEGHYGQEVTIDLCHACAGFWFDGRESLELAPGATLKLFTVIHENRAARQPLGRALGCPRCRDRLARTMDMQRDTRFSYWSCPGGHGRFETFFDFLREKNFVRPLGAQELAELRQKLRTITCSSCGAPLDLEKETVCRYCRTPLAMLDPKQVEKAVAELKRGAEQRPVDPTLPMRLLLDRQKVDRAFAGHDHDWSGVTDTFGLLEIGLVGAIGLLEVAS